MAEIYEPIPGDHREISNYGNIRNKKTKKPSYIYIPRKAKNRYNSSKGVVVQLDSDFNLVETYISANAVNVKYGFRVGPILEKDSLQIFQGFYWMYEKDYNKTFLNVTEV